MAIRLAFGLSFLLASIASAQTPNADHFEKNVRPVLVEKCLGCHGAEGKKPKAGLKMNTRQDLLNGGNAGPSVVPGKPEESLLVQVVKYDGDLKMPPKGKLKDEEIAAIAEWVKNGAVWPDAKAAVETPGATVKQGPLFTSEQKAFWAYQPVRDAKPAQDAKNPIDAFLAAKFDSAGLKPAPRTSKATLLRRVTFDLIGLPPTPEELDSFLKDESSNAFEKVIDRLLASPHYGERWGRHWLDVARYADSNGLDENTAFGNAWRYRDYVVRSFNADKPYDEFLREQIAGDLLPPSNDPAIQTERTIATGYLVLGPKVLAEPDKQKMLIDIADEQLDTLGKGVLGLTIGCARCHDHKFDPLPTRDYYSMLAIFTSTRTMQGLGTVAKAFEKPLDGPESAEQAGARTRLESLRKEVRQVEKQFGSTPESNKAKRTELHLKAEAKRAEIKTLEAKVKPAEFALCVEEGTPAAYGTAPRNLYVQVRGNYGLPGEEAPPVFPRIVVGESAKSFVSLQQNPSDKLAPTKTRFGQLRSGSGRLELAHWIADAKNPLTARVFVNRVWQHHFGEGIVRTPDNFGKLGDRPTHPELFDWLASRFIESGWSTKQLHKLILSSEAYSRSSLRNPDSKANADPENRLLSYFPRRRLEAEPIRDAMLAAAGTLDPTLGGTLYKGGNFEYVTTDQSRSTVGYDTMRRTIYLPVIRNNVYPFLATFDFPDPSTMTGQRASTVVAPQALYMLNSPFVAQHAGAFADRLLKAEPSDDSARVRLAYRIAYAREPRTEEASRLLGFIASQSGETDPIKQKRAAWQAAAQAIFASNEFAFVE